LSSPPSARVWSRFGSPVFSLNSSSDGATRTVDGQAFVQATVSTGCGNVALSKEVSAGVPTYNYITAEAGWVGSGQGKVMSPSGETEMEAWYTGLSSIFQYGWEIWDHSNWSVNNRTVSYSSIDMDYWHTPTPSNQRILIRTRNACGWGLYQETYWTFSTLFAKYSVSPNPAINEVGLLFDNLVDPRGLPEKIELLHESSTIPVQVLKITKSEFDKIKNSGNKLFMNVANLARGTYYLHVSYAKCKEIR
jgi:hypothetical protein